MRHEEKGEEALPMPAVNGCTCKLLTRVDTVDAISSELRRPPVTLMKLSSIAYAIS